MSAPWSLSEGKQTLPNVDCKRPCTMTQKNPSRTRATCQKVKPVTVTTVQAALHSRTIEKRALSLG
jgi:hypothetical protein